MTTSLIPAVKDALVTLLAAHSSLQGVDVHKHYPNADEVPHEIVYLGPRVEGSQPFAGMKSGRKARDDNPTVRVVFQVLMEEGDPDDAEERALELFGALVDIIADDYTLGIEGHNVRAELGEYATDTRWAALGAQSIVEIDVSATGRLE